MSDWAHLSPARQSHLSALHAKMRGRMRAPGAGKPHGVDPVIWTDAMKLAVLEGIEKQTPWQKIADHAGVSATTLRRWLAAMRLAPALKPRTRNAAPADAGEILRLRRIALLARAAVQPQGKSMSVDTNALRELMRAAHAAE